MLRLTVAAAAFAACALQIGCGGETTFIECPVGTLPEGSRCVAITDDTQRPRDTHSDTRPDDTTPPSTTSTPPDTRTNDTTPPPTDTQPTSRPTGSACEKNAECAGGTCLDWTGGYCTALGCDVDPCSDDDQCIPFAANHVCMAACQSPSDCRATGQACKTLQTPDGLASACVGVDDDALAIGAGCGDATDCLGPATCHPGFPGGYCAVLGCDATSCPSGARCVKVNGAPTCLKGCGQDEDCGSTPAAERKCGLLQGVGGTSESVCISGVSGKAVGAACLSDFECASGTCQILGEGRCSQTNSPCFPETASTDCTGAEFCHVTNESRVGVCAQPCAAGTFPCPGESHCVAEGTDAARGACRPACTALDDSACNKDVGMSCAFGLPATGGQGRYVCAFIAAGAVGAPCSGNAACKSDDCILPAGGGDGYCSASCVGDGLCPFPGSCVYGDTDRCFIACLSTEDCPAGFTCDLASGSARDVCVPD